MSSADIHELIMRRLISVANDEEESRIVARSLLLAALATATAEIGKQEVEVIVDDFLGKLHTSPPLC